MNRKLIESFHASPTKLIAVSKTRSVDQITSVYEQGIRDFGENRVQELLTKVDKLPQDIKWHLIGHLQKNKIKYIIDFIHLIHSVDSISLLNEIQKQSARRQKVTKILLQFKVAQEESKYGQSLEEFLTSFTTLNEYPNIQFCGIMAMASFVSDKNQIITEFKETKSIFDQLQKSLFRDVESFKEISMGMSGDYNLAIDNGSTMVRIGSLLFNN